MCIIFFAYKKHPQHKLVLAGNRDEFYKRPTEGAKFWKEYSYVLAGRDLEKMGTWLGITKAGRFAVITNYRDTNLLVENPISRGNLIKNYLVSDSSPEEYLEKIKKHKDYYNPFNLLVLDNKGFYYYSNVENDIKELESGIYGLSNALLDTPWPKIKRGKELFKSIIEKRRNISLEDLFEVLKDKSRPKDEELPETGMGLEWERILSSIFIESENYGTRASTILTIDNDNNVTFIEKSLVDDKKRIWNKEKYKFTIKPYKKDK